MVASKTAAAAPAAGGPAMEAGPAKREYAGTNIANSSRAVSSCMKFWPLGVQSRFSKVNRQQLTPVDKASLDCGLLGDPVAIIYHTQALRMDRSDEVTALRVEAHSTAFGLVLKQMSLDEHAARPVGHQLHMQLVSFKFFKEAIVDGTEYVGDASRKEGHQWAFVQLFPNANSDALGDRVLEIAQVFFVFF